MLQEIELVTVHLGAPPTCYETSEVLTLRVATSDKCSRLFFTMYFISPSPGIIVVYDDR